MLDWPILTTITFLPSLGAFFILLIRGDEKLIESNARAVALWTTFVTLFLTILIVCIFDHTNPNFQFVERQEWLGQGIDYAMGVDGISILFVMLTTALVPLCIIASWQSITYRVREYMVFFLLLETLMIGVFCALDLTVFYIFFEGSLIPLFFIIGIWGGKKRVYASYKFFLYTLLGSVLMLLAIMYMYWQAGTTFIPDLMVYTFNPKIQTWLWLAFFASFAVKIPMWPVHTWLPDAHVEAPTAGSVILAGVLLKMGGYGFLRFSIPMFPIATDVFADLIFWMSVIAVIYTSLVALVQEDIKKLIAYASVAHMGYVTVGIFSLNQQGIQGAVFQMLSHGWVSAGLFLCVGVIYDRIHTRDISVYGGLVNRMPIYAVIFFIFTMANIGLPGTSGFVGEFLIIIGIFQVNTWITILITTGVILSACYALSLYRRISYGKLENEILQSILDVNLKEIIVFIPLIIATILFGFFPMPILEITASSIDLLLQNYHESLSGIK